jgi:hypothetical protein
MKPHETPIQKVMCATCPFRKGSKYRFLVGEIAASALTEAARICHSTGTTGFNGDTGKPDRICRGARDLQLDYFYSIGFLPAATDAAWSAKWKELQKQL